MTSEALIAALEARRMTLDSRDGQLVVKGPRSGLTPELRGHLRRLKPEVLALLDARAEARRAAARTPPLSIAQARIRRLSLITPASSMAGNVPLGFWIDGPLELERLERAIARLVERHDVFRMRCDGACNTVVETARPALETHDLRSIALADREAALDEHLVALLDRPFDLDAPPHLRAAVYRLGEQRWALMLVSHVYAFDGRSTPLLLDGLSAAYADPDTLADAPRYADFARAQRQSGPAASASHLYWRRALADVSLDAGPPEETRARGVFESLAVPVRLPQDLTDSARRFARDVGGTLFHVLLGAYATQAWRHRRRPSIAISTIVSHRPDADAERTIGSFAQPIPLPARFSPDGTFRDLVLQLGASAAAAMAHLDLPYEALLPELAVEQRRQAPFRVLFVLHHGGRRAVKLRLGAADVTPLRVFPPRTNHGLELVLADNDGQVSGHLIVDRARLPEPDASAFVDDYLTLLARLVAAPETALADIEPRRWPTVGSSPDVPQPPDVAPQSETARRVSEIWTALLGARPGPDDDFFAVGGHSLLALALLSRIEDAFGPLGEDAVARFGVRPTAATLTALVDAG